MEAKLVVVSGAARPSEFKLKLPTIIGRSKAVDLPIGHPLISRQHCELFAEENVLKIRDLGSLNGTFVRETRIAEDTMLEPGDEFSVGPLTFKAVYGKMPADAAEGDDERDMSPPMQPQPDMDETADVNGYGAPPEIDTDESPVGLTTVELGGETVPAPNGQPAGAADGGELDWLSEAPDDASEPAAAGGGAEDDFLLADSTDEGLDTAFDSTVDLPRPALPSAKAAKAVAGKAAGKLPLAKAAAPASTPSKSKAAKPTKPAPAAADSSQNPPAATTDGAADGDGAAGGDDNDFAPPPQQHGHAHGNADLDNLLDFLQ